MSVMDTSHREATGPSRTMAALAAAFITVTTLGLLKGTTDPCDEVPGPGEKCVGRGNEIVGVCTGGTCPAGLEDFCPTRVVVEWNYIGCTLCTSGGSSDSCREYNEPTLCAEAQCQLKSRDRACMCTGSNQCVLDPIWRGTYSLPSWVHLKECVL